MLFTTSWDDGHPLDLRLAALLHRRGFAGTFYVPGNNREGRPVLGSNKLRELDGEFELGSHTQDHCYLTTVSDQAARRQIWQGRASLEDALGHGVDGFCYPGGKFRPAHRAMVEAEGFRFARTTCNLCLDTGTHAYERPTTLQFYPHTRAVYMRNLIRYGRPLARSRLGLMACASSNLLGLLKASLLLAVRSDGVFHIWGHSWELELFNGWNLLDEFLAFASDHVDAPNRVHNAAVFGVSSPKV